MKSKKGKRIEINFFLLYNNTKVLKMYRDNGRHK